MGLTYKRYQSLKRVSSSTFLNSQIVMFNFSETHSSFGDDGNELHNPAGQIHEDGLNRGDKPVTTGLPKHGTRRARAQPVPTPERT